MEPVREAYTEWADEYATLFGSADAIDPEDHDFVAGWAAGRDGRIVDVGCGPGQWTDLLRELGCDVYGVDPVPAFLARARRHYPESTFRLGTAQRLGEADGALAGILAWYSLIHTAPDDLGAVFDEFARCLPPGGEVLLGFFEGPRAEPFDHAVVTAYWWPVPELAAWLARAGFAIVETTTRTSGKRPHGAVIARRLPG
jgi:SAM-dependent methyltransferase